MNYFHKMEEINERLRARVKELEHELLTIRIQRDRAVSLLEDPQPWEYIWKSTAENLIDEIYP
jgi:hypothetical protein